MARSAAFIILNYVTVIVIVISNVIVTSSVIITVNVIFATSGVIMAIFVTRCGASLVQGEIFLPSRDKCTPLRTVRSFFARTWWRWQP